MVGFQAKTQFRDQRWLYWRNADQTNTPVCPAFGFVEIVGWEAVGIDIVAVGRSASCFDRSFWDEQGPKFNHAFNSELSVNPGEIGQLTVDLPTWVLVTPSTRPYQFGDFLTCGIFYSGDGQAVRVGDLWKLGLWSSASSTGVAELEYDGPSPPGSTVHAHDTTGYNVYRFEQDLNRCFVGGIKTFVKDGNSG